MIRQSGEEPVVIEYLKEPPSRGRLTISYNLKGLILGLAMLAGAATAGYAADITGAGSTFVYPILCGALGRGQGQAEDERTEPVRRATARVRVTQR
jgi:hypothetical protein